MRRRALIVIAIAILLFLLGGFTVAAAWWWFPRAQEPPYRFLLTWGVKGDAPGEFVDPIGIAVAGDEVFVSDAGNHRVQVFDREAHSMGARTWKHQG